MQMTKVDIIPIFYQENAFIQPFTDSQIRLPHTKGIFNLKTLVSLAVVMLVSQYRSTCGHPFTVWLHNSSFLSYLGILELPVDPYHL